MGRALQGHTTEGASTVVLQVSRGGALDQASRDIAKFTRSAFAATRNVCRPGQAPYVEYYYPALADGVTHLSLNRTTAVQRLRSLDRQATARLVRNARRVADELICPECLVNYWRLLVAKMRAYFGIANVLDDPERLRRVLEALPFDDLELAELDVNVTRRGHEYTSLRLLTNRDDLLALADLPVVPDGTATLDNDNWNRDTKAQIKHAVTNRLRNYRERARRDPPTPDRASAPRSFKRGIRTTGPARVKMKFDPVTGDRIK